MRHERLLYGTILFSLLGIFLQVTSKFHFFYIEQLQLFQFTSDYLADKMIYPGGLSLIIGEFLTQFFIFPYVGPIILAALLTLATGSMGSLLQAIRPEKALYSLYALPALALLLIQYDFNYRLQGTIAFLLCLFCLNGWTRIRRFRYRLLAASLVTPLLFWAGGPVAGLFVASMTIIEIFGNPKRGIYSLAIVAEFISIGAGSVWGLIVPEYRLAFLPDAYYHSTLETPFTLYLAWLALPVCLSLTFICPKTKFRSKRSIVLNHVSHAIIILILCWICIPRYDDRKSYTLKVLDYYARTGQWEQIIRRCQGTISNYLYLTHLNMALAEKGELGERLFAFDQHGPQGLLVPWNKTFAVSTLLSDAYFAIGEIAIAQEMAFESYMSVLGDGNPRNLQRLVQTNLIFGAYPIAEKYISILEKTFAYRDWAKRHRAFLYNDEAVEKDPLLGPKRRGLPKENCLAGIEGIDKDLLRRAEQNPEDQLPIQFAGAFYLLSKDMKSFRTILEKYYGTSVLPSLPTSFQEAVILLEEHDETYWKRFNVSEPVIRQFALFREQITRNRNNPQLARLIQTTFGNTFWAYYLFK